jgi:hypothetical protein
MPTPSGRYMNVSGVGFTPSGGSLTTITGVKSIRFNEGIEVKKEGADYDAFPTVKAADWIQPTFDLETLDAGVLISQLAGAVGTFVFLVRDVNNGAVTGGGAKLFTVTNAFVEQRQSQHQHREFSRQTLTFGCISSDGSTHPVAVTSP